MSIAQYPDIHNLKLFSGVSEEERQRLIDQGQIVRFAAKEYLFRRGDPIDRFYIVCSGLVQLVKETPEGKKVTIDVTGQGRTICKSDIFEGLSKNHRVSAIAVTDAVLLTFPNSWLLTIAKNPIIALNILSAISEYAHMIEVEIEHKSTMTAAQQLGCFLQRLCIMHDLNPRGFELPYSKALIASRLGMNPETFSRTLDSLKTHGISVSGSHVEFTDIEALEEYVCEHCSMAGECNTQESLQTKLSGG